MQDITPALGEKAQRIQSYGPAGFRIAGTDFAGSVLVSAFETTDISALSLEDIQADELSRLWTMDPPLEVLLVGTGSTHQLLPPALRDTLKARGIGVDAMSTGAAARTFNVLLAEERRVAALLLLPQ